MSVADIEKRREERKAALAEAYEEQFEKDLFALDALEAEHGDGRVKRMNAKYFVPGLPTFIVVKSPGGTALYKRYTDMVRAAGKNVHGIGAAQEMLGEACIAYPSDPDVLKAMIKEFNGAKISAALVAVGLVELEAQEEKKD